MLAVGPYCSVPTSPVRAPISDLITSRSQQAGFVPSIALARWLSKANRQEQLIIDWAEEKRGNLDARDLLFRSGQQFRRERRPAFNDEIIVGTPPPFCSARPMTPAKTL